MVVPVWPQRPKGNKTVGPNQSTDLIKTRFKVGEEKRIERGYILNDELPYVD